MYKVCCEEFKCFWGGDGEGKHWHELPTSEAVMRLVKYAYIVVGAFRGVNGVLREGSGWGGRYRGSWWV